jgi:hypothetical protein
VVAKLDQISCIVDEVLTRAVYDSRYPQYAAPQGEEEIAADDDWNERGKDTIEHVPLLGDDGRAPLV